MVNPRSKGSVGEREVVEILRSRGYNVRRSPHSGALEWAKGDILGAPWHLEVKRCESVRIAEWCRQAEEQAKKRVPLVVFRRSREPWRVCLRFDDFLALIEEAGGRG